MDILFLAALTFYIFFKLSKHLGRIDEDEKKQIEEKITLMKAAQEKVQDIVKNQEKLVGSASTNKATNISDELAVADLDDSAKSNLKQILSACNIDLGFFLGGAKSAFEMIIKSFASGDLQTLKMLLSEKLYAGFESAVNMRKTQDQTLTTNLISIDKSQITSANLEGNIALIEIQFTSQQINYVTSKDGEVIDGSKNEISEITDIWTFKKDITDSNPNWTISATGN